MGASDVLLAGAILAGAGWVLYRSLWKARGRCAGCSGCGSGGEAPVQLGRRRR
ncbi:MAG TPA: FeoB-associated Cys-rich membrane protein [Anaeromyxobacter sp.]